MIQVEVYCMDCGRVRARHYVTGELARHLGANPDGPAVQPMPGLCPACYETGEQRVARSA